MVSDLEKDENKNSKPKRVEIDITEHLARIMANNDKLLKELAKH